METYTFGDEARRLDVIIDFDVVVDLRGLRGKQLTGQHKTKNEDLIQKEKEEDKQKKLSSAGAGESRDMFEHEMVRQALQSLGLDADNAHSLNGSINDAVLL